MLENVTEVDKISYLKSLKKEFWSFPKNVGWNIDINSHFTDKNHYSTSDSPTFDPSKQSTTDNETDESKMDKAPYTAAATAAFYREKSSTPVTYSSSMNVEEGGKLSIKHTSNKGYNKPLAVPSDAVSGNMCEAINTTMALLDKHYIDR